MSFWTKCGKLLTNGGGTLINCRTCPCGYYGLFVFVARSINGPQGDPSPCSGTDISVAPYQVINGKIDFTSDMGLYWSGCIEINVQQDQKGRVGHAKGCADYWNQCVEWDQNDNCIRYEPYYYDCYDIDVYRIGACYQDLNEFKAFVYSKCSNITPPYPNLWQTWYGRKYTSSEASNCIYKDWDVNQDSWYSYAYWRYKLQAKFHWQRYDCNLTISLDSQKWHQEEAGRYYWCDGDCRAYGDNGCTDCDGTLQQEIYYNDILDCNAHIIYKPSWGGSQVYAYQWELCERQQGQPQCICIDAYNSASTAGISSINSEVSDILDDKQNYWIGQDNYTTSPCFNKDYSSKFQPNECWASWWVQNLHRKWCYYAKVTIEKWDNRVQYNGVKIRATVIQYDGGGDGGTQQSYPLSVNHQTTRIYDGATISCPWGTQLEFPIANNMIGWTLANNPHCVNYGDYDYPRYFPYDSGCEYSSRVTISLQVISFL